MIIDCAANDGKFFPHFRAAHGTSHAISVSGGRHGSCRQLIVMSDISGITWWMAMLTILVGIQTIAMAVIAVKGVALFKRADSTLDAVDRAIEPITQGTRELMGDLHALRETAQRAERGVSAAIDRVCEHDRSRQARGRAAVLAGLRGRRRGPRRFQYHLSAPAPLAESPRG